VAGTVKILNSSGHATLTEENSTVQERETAFHDELDTKGRRAFDLKTKEPMDAWDPEADVLIVPPIAGGS